MYIPIKQGYLFDLEILYKNFTTYKNANTLKIKNMKFSFYLISIWFSVSICYQKLFYKAFIDPSTTQLENIWDIQSSDDDIIQFEKYLSCSNDLYFGTFATNY